MTLRRGSTQAMNGVNDWFELSRNSKETQCAIQVVKVEVHSKEASYRLICFIPFLCTVDMMRGLRSARRSVSKSSIPTALPVVLRTYATLSPYSPQSSYDVFDESSKTRQRDRALLRLKSQLDAQSYSVESNFGESTSVVDYLREELSHRLLERIEVSTPCIKLERSDMGGC